MYKKTDFWQNIKNSTDIKSAFMISKIIFRDASKTMCLLSDKTGSVKAIFYNPKTYLEAGYVLEVEANNSSILEVKNFELLNSYEISDYLPTIQRSMDSIMDEIEGISKKYILSPEAKKLDAYFFENEQFLKMFTRCIGGVSMHHNYIGGLAEHTLNVMYLTSIFCERYDCRHKEIAILSSKLHDIGKIHEFSLNGPFRYSLRGDLEGHISIGVQMIDEAIKKTPALYSEDFTARIKGCVLQHHGKLEYGSPKNANMEESIIVNFADSVDAKMNKLYQLKENTKIDSWSEYDRMLETKIYF